MRTKTKLWKNFYERLGEINPKYSPRENAVIRETMTITRGYRKRAMKIIEILDIQDSILEIGCGYGGLAREILKKMPISSYTVIDNEKMLNQTKKFLGNKIEYVDAKQIKMLEGRKFGFFISHHCLSETPSEYRQYILENIIKNCQKISVIDINDGCLPTRKMLKAGFEIVPLNIEEWIRKYFMINKTIAGKKQSMYVGKRLR